MEALWFEDGLITVETSEGPLYFPYTPALLLHPAVFPLLDVDLPARTHPYAVEVRGPLDDLIRIARRAARLSGAYLLLPPERQFALERGIRLHANLTPHGVSLAVPDLRDDRQALEFLLGPRFGNPALAFLENVFFRARIAADLTFHADVPLSPSALREVFVWNLSPETLGRGDVLLPSSIVRVTAGDPVLFPSCLSDADAGFGKGVLEYGEGRLGVLADAEILGYSYEVVRPQTVSASPGLLPRSLASLLSSVPLTRILSVPVGNIVEIALETDRHARFWHLFEAVAHVVSNLSRVLASTNALTPVGRRTLLVAHNLRRRAPEVYKRLSPHIPVCSRGLNVLESFLRALSSLRWEPRHSSMYPRGPWIHTS